MASLEELLPGPTGHVPDLQSRQDDAFQELVKRETREAVERGISLLPFNFRIALVLKDFVELPVADVAKILDINPATVKTRCHRARLLLRRTLSERFLDQPSPAARQSPQLCFDLLQAKLDALDRGVEFSIADPDLCERCNAVFHQLDLTKEACSNLLKETMPDKLLDAVRRAPAAIA